MIQADPGPLYKRIAWFVALWAVSVAAIACLAYIIRWWLY